MADTLARLGKKISNSYLDKQRKTMTILIIDADSIVYAAAFASQDWAVFDEDGNLSGIYKTRGDAKEAAIWEDDTIEPYPMEDAEAINNTDAIIENILDQFDNVEDVVVWLTAPDITQNFRYNVTSEYKANRKDFQKPAHYRTARDRLVNHWGAKISRPGWEADDELSATGWYHWLYGTALHDVVLCSIDKDLDTVPGRHYRWPTHNKEGSLYWLTEEEARMSYWASVLTGDKVDNIKGLHRVGIKKATAMLEGCETDKECYDVCKDKWIEYLGKEGYTEEEAIEQMHNSCQLLYLMRGENDEGWRPPE